MFKQILSPLYGSQRNHCTLPSAGTKPRLARAPAPDTLSFALSETQLNQATQLF